MPVVLRSSDHPQDRTADKVNPERLMVLFGKLEERLSATAETVDDEDLRQAFLDLAHRVEVVHHDAAVMIF